MCILKIFCFSSTCRICLRGGIDGGGCRSLLLDDLTLLLDDLTLLLGDLTLLLDDLTLLALYCDWLCSLLYICFLLLLGNLACAYTLIARIWTLHIIIFFLW